MSGTKDSGAKLLKGLSLGDVAVLLIRTTQDYRKEGLRSYTALAYYNVELWACPEFIHMHDGKTHYTKTLYEAIRTTETKATDWIEQNCDVVTGPVQS